MLTWLFGDVMAVPPDAACAVVVVLASA